MLLKGVIMTLGGLPLYTIKKDVSDEKNRTVSSGIEGIDRSK